MGPMKRPKRKECGDVLGAVQKRLQAERFDGLIEPEPRVAHVEQAFHGLDHDFPVRDHAQVRGPGYDGGLRLSREAVGLARGDEDDASIEQIAGQTSPARKRSRSMGSSQPGFN